MVLGYHTQALKYNAASDGSSKNLGINGTLTPLNLVQDGIEVARFYNQDDWVASSMSCRHYGNTKSVQCNFDDNFDENAPNKTRGYIGYGSRTDDHQAIGVAYLSQEVKPNLEAKANFVYGGSKVGIIVQFMAPGKMVGKGSMPKDFGIDIYHKGNFTQ